jgi:hypothetical protein
VRRDIFTEFTTKPEFPKDGLSMPCPSCKEVSVYQRHQLIYRAT